MKRYQMFIDGEWRDAGNGASFTSVNPASEEDWATFADATAVADPFVMR